MRRVLIALLLGSTVSIAGADVVAKHAGSQAPTESEILSTLSARSHIAEAELRTWLSHCDADQQSLYFCAYHDVVAADLTLKKVLAKKELQLPACKSTIDERIAKWEKFRNQNCEESAKNEYGEGSLRSTAQAVCIASETASMTKKLERIGNCNQRF